jgi:flagellar protein FliO/FliZ
MTLLDATRAAAGSAAVTGADAAELLRVLLSLVAVVAMILIIAWLARRAQSRVRPGGKRMRCLETLSVGSKEKVLLVQVGDIQMVVGTSPAGLRTLLVLDEPLPEAPERKSAALRAVDTVGAANSGAGSSNLSFGESLRTILAQWKGHG